MNLMGYHVYREVWKPVKDELITFRLEPDNEYDKWAMAGASGSLTVGHVQFGTCRGVDCRTDAEWSRLNNKFRRGFQKFTSYSGTPLDFTNKIPTLCQLSGIKLVRTLYGPE